MGTGDKAVGDVKLLTHVYLLPILILSGYISTFPPTRLHVIYRNKFTLTFSVTVSHTHIAQEFDRYFQFFTTFLLHIILDLLILIIWSASAEDSQNTFLLHSPCWRMPLQRNGYIPSAPHHSKRMWKNSNVLHSGKCSWLLQIGRSLTLATVVGEKHILSLRNVASFSFITSLKTNWSVAVIA